MRNIRRYWINAPSILSILHSWHGENLIVDVDSLDDNGSVTAYFTKGKVVSAVMPLYLLSEGWANDGRT